MKKLVVLMMVLAMAQISWAGIATLRIAADDVKQDYTPSDVITIELVCDFGVGGIGIDYTNANPAGGIASSPVLNSLFTESPLNPGTVKNIGPLLIQAVAGSTSLTAGDVQPGAVVWSFDFHVPDLPVSTIIEISTAGFFAAASDFSDMATETNVVAIHIIPEPMTVALLGLGGLFLRRRK